MLANQKARTPPMMAPSTASFQRRSTARTYQPSSMISSSAFPCSSLTRSLRTDGCGAILASSGNDFDASGAIREASNVPKHAGRVKHSNDAQAAMLETFAQRFLPQVVAATVRDWRARLAPQGSVRDRFAGAVFWSLAGMGVSNAAGLITGVALAQLMGREGYGEIGVIVGSYALFSQLGGLGLRSE